MPAAPQLPPGLAVRPATPGDLEQVVALCVRCDLADLGEADTEPDDIRAAWRRPGYDLSANTLLVVSGDHLVAYADVFEGEAFGMVDPARRGEGIGTWLLHRIEQLARGHAGGSAAGAEGTMLELSAPASDRAFQQLAERAGYHRSRSSWLMRLDMAEPPPPPAWPDGIRVRGFDRDRDARPVHRLIQDAFVDIGNQPPRSFEFWEQTNLERGDHDPTLWFLAEAGGELVGASLCFSGPLGGYVAQLAVRRDQRGRGLGLALLRHGFAALHRRGVREVFLHVDSQNRTGATRLYERAGMVVQHRMDTWRRPLA
jgi:mycothiol synthase